MCITEAAISQEYNLERDCRRNILYVYWGYTEQVWHCPKQTHCLGSAVIHEGKNKWTNGHEFLLMAFLFNRPPYVSNFRNYYTEGGRFLCWI